MRAGLYRKLPLASALLLALYQPTVFAQSNGSSSSGNAPAPYEIPLSIVTSTSPVVDSNPTNPYWTPVSPANPYPNQNYQWTSLYITVGVNGGTPESLIFDTGSTAFNIDAGPNYQNDSWLPLKPGTQVTLGQPLFYGDGSYGNQGAQTSVSSVQFYQLNNNLGLANNQPTTSFTPGQQIPITLNVQQFATGESLGPSGNPGAVVGEYLGPSFGGLTNSQYQQLLADTANPAIVAYWNQQFPGLVEALQNPTPMYQDLNWLQGVQSGNPGGIFGAGPFNGGPGQLSVLGGMTTSGYVVAANSQPGAATGTIQDCGSCAHVIMNLTPAVRAQFISVVPWDGGSSGTFPNSGAPVQANQFGQDFNIVINHGGTAASVPTLLDTGTPELGQLADDATLAAQNAAQKVDPNAQPLDSGNGNAQGNVVAGQQISLTGAAPGAQTSTFTTASPYYGNTAQMLTLAPGDGSSSALIGLEFFLANSVMYDLQNQTTGYTPFFVSVDPISTSPAGYTVTSAMAAQGIAGIISGSGPFSIGSGAAAQLSNVNTYTGATIIQQGGWLGLAGPGSIASSSGVQADGVFDVSRAGPSAYITSLSGSGSVALGATTLNLTQANGSFGGQLADGGLGGGSGGGVIIAAGQETFSGTNTYTGSTGIGSQGSLVLNGSLAGPVLDAGALSGHGSLGSLAVTGVVAPGQSAGSFETLTVNGSFHQQAGSSYLAQITPSGASSLIAVQGAAVLDPGAGLQVLAAVPQGQSFSKGSQYALLSASGALSGTYSNLALPRLSAVLGLAPRYDADHLYLDVVQMRSLLGLTGSPNQTATLAGIQSLPGSSPVFTAVTNLPSDGAIVAASSTLSGEVHASTQSAFIDDSRFVRDAVTSRLRQAGQDGQAGADGHAAPAVQNKSNGLALWGQFVGSWDRLDGNTNTSRLSDNVGGFLLGADAPLGEHARAGLVTGYTQTGFQSTLSNRNSSDDGYLGLYAGGHWDGWQLDGGLAYTQHTLSISRSIAVPGLVGATWDRSKAYTSQAFVEVGYDFVLHATTIEPFAQGAYVQQASDHFQESGNAAALSGSGSRHGVTYSTVGAHLQSGFPWQGDWLTAYGTLAWRHAAGYIVPNSQQAFADGTDFSVSGVPIARNAAVVEAGLQLDVRHQVSFSLGYNGQIAQHSLDSGVRGGFSWRF